MSRKVKENNDTFEIKENESLNFEEAITLEETDFTNEILLEQEQTEEQVKPKGKRGRKPGQKNKPKSTEPKENTTVDIFNLQQILDTIFNGILANKNQNWAIPPEQLNLLATVTNQYIDVKYPNLFKEDKVTVNLIAVWGMIVLPRFILIVKPQNYIARIFGKIKERWRKH